MRALMILVAFVGLATAGPALAQDQTEMLEMRDGVRLATDLYFPDSDGPWPTLLIRTPYGKAEAAGQAGGFVDRGVAVVIQDLRGRYDSEGTDMVFTSDGDGALSDGVDTCAWIVDQQWSDGLIGTTGGSALGIVQYVQASAQPPGLVVMNPVVATPNLRDHAVFWSGVFREALVVGWLEGQGSLHWLDDVAEHPFEDDFWDPVQTTDRFGDVTAAGLHEGGWYDIFGQGTIDGFVGYQQDGGPGAAGNQKLIMGPWTHGGMRGRDQGELRYPANAEQPPYPDAFPTLFNYHLGADAPIDDTPADVPTVQYYVMGDVDDASAPGNQWRTADAWPPGAATVRLHLQPGGGLTEACPPDDGGVSSWVYDPDDPSPTICGGNLTIDAGPCDQRTVEARDDVVVFSTGPLDAPMEITGRVRAHLFVDIDRPDADLMVRMTDVYPDGRSMLIADGATRLAARGSSTSLSPLAAGEIVRGVVDLWSTSIVLAAGHELRISVSSSNSPRFAASRNNGLPYPESVEGDGAPVTVRLHHDATHASYLEAPDPGREITDFQTCGEAPPVGDDDDASCDCGASLGGGSAGRSVGVLALLAGVLVGLRRRRSADRACRRADQRES
jgi:uncharacterized protein